MVTRFNSAGAVVLAAGAAASIGRWPWHWRGQPAVAVVAGVAVVALVAGILIGRTSALAAAAAVCLLDGLLELRAWSAHLPLHCRCVRLAGSPALLGWGGAIAAADTALVALSIWLGRSMYRCQRCTGNTGNGSDPDVSPGHDAVIP